MEDVGAHFFQQGTCALQLRVGAAHHEGEGAGEGEVPAAVRALARELRVAGEAVEDGPLRGAVGLDVLVGEWDALLFEPGAGLGAGAYPPRRRAPWAR